MTYGVQKESEVQRLSFQGDGNNFGFWLYFVLEAMSLWGLLSEGGRSGRSKGCDGVNIGVHEPHYP